ncbi:MFS transporter [Paraburkholderia caballeronis]|uniref:Predicted arabinose efflux permease, MFS family n=1 Tax=Paraburkholderia caballeronis TaxID=416943 RepID=A0A1H7L887_9BURK|nr:MFS transporter [Paraburkholderia caballeronis]PXW28319.1 putative MFS family arabinose efflux permease [Paraburkholderia caballeronis]PXX03685.1 putative MFS family arabinose efflux permease [Paraburkholderia caballeronis]RAK04429.1 putative MFS family arabinose efflux permease [Paraburkholderia caballeronis]SED80554.1 Predicted arabinose efflux permease, MFS family [Paraburkholderia caballeronis]SEK94695.1 Predicted arabinose efflux permease, MFS family [Paraburkholderia caballeronis]
MSAPSRTPNGEHQAVKLTPGLIALFAFSCGAIVANLYYAQPITELIGPSLHMSAGATSFIVSLTQIGYALGLFFIVPLGDLVENRRLMIATALISILSLAAASLMHSPGWFLVMSFSIGFSSVAVQILIPLAAHLAPDRTRGRVVGTIMAGLLLGILLSRPLSSLAADHFGWRFVFSAAAALMTLVTAVLALTIPRRTPEHHASYFGLIGSLFHLLRTTPVLRHRALYQGLMFASFSLFWTAVPIELTRHYGLSQSAIALFALVGAIGATSAPVAGRLADAGYSVRATFIALAAGALAYAPALVHPASGVYGLVITGIVLDFAVQMNMVLGQREIYALHAASRNRLNALYMTSIFVGGAIGSAVASMLFERGGWTLVASVAAAFPLAAYIHFLRVGRPHGLSRR